MTNQKEIYFIDDPNSKDRDYFLKEFDKTTDSNDYRKKVFLRSFLLQLFKACNKKPLVETQLKPKKLTLNLNTLQKIEPIKMNIQRPSATEKIYPVKKIPYPKAMPLYQVKPIIKRKLANKRLPPLRPKQKNVFMEDGHLYYQADKVGKSYLDQVKSILTDFGIMAVYCDGINKPLLVDYLNYKQLRTKIKFSDKKRLNNMLKKLARDNGFKFSKDKPIILEKLKDGSLFQANLGNEFMDSKFIIKKGKIL